MEESETVAGAAPIIRAMAPGLSAAFGTLLRGRQDRKNLEADRSVIDGMIQTGLTNFRYRGIAMEFEAFADAHQEEIERLVTNTVNAMLKADSLVDWSKVNLDQFNPEFRRRWVSEASNVSDETLQGLWARLLAGELESPGSVSNDTMSIARDLNKERAEEFQTLCSATLCHFGGAPMIIVGCGNPGTASLRSYGLPYEVLAGLAHHRLIIGDMTTYHDLPLGPSQPMIPVQHQELTLILRRPNDETPNDRTHRIRGILFTTAGKELFAVVEKTPVPEYREAMVTSLEKEGWIVTRVSDPITQ